jgi:5-methylcytosine-specific restriction protein A
MPPRAARVCPERGCAALITGSARYCPEHTRQRQRSESRERRAAGTHADYGPAWQKISARYLAEHPVCTWTGCSRPSEVAHHIVERSQGGPDDWSNLRALCRAHHTELHKRKQERSRG